MCGCVRIEASRTSCNTCRCACLEVCRCTRKAIRWESSWASCARTITTFAGYKRSVSILIWIARGNACLGSRLEIQRNRARKTARCKTSIASFTSRSACCAFVVVRYWFRMKTSKYLILTNFKSLRKYLPACKCHLDMCSHTGCCRSK